MTNGNGRAWQVLRDLPSWQAVGARAADPGWEQCLAGALTAFQDCGWPMNLLRPAGT